MIPVGVRQFPVLYLFDVRGKISDSDSVNLGSNPSSPAIKKQRYFLHNLLLFAGRKSRNCRNRAGPAAAQNSAQCRCRANRPPTDHLGLGDECGNHALRGCFACGGHKSRHSRLHPAPAHSRAALDKICCGCCRHSTLSDLPETYAPTGAS
jgi:hypothetical protein